MTIVTRKISQLTAAGDAEDDDEFEINRSGVTYKVTRAQIIVDLVDEAGAQAAAQSWFDGLTGTHDATTALLGSGELGLLNPAQVSGGEITAGTETALRSVSPADIVSFITQHAPGGGLTTELDTDTAITVGSGTDGEHHVLTSDSAITLTLDAQATAGMESAFTKAGSGAVTVSVEAGAGYWVPSDDIGGSAATASFTMTGYGYFVCIRNTGGNAAEWLFVGQSDLAASIAGALTVTGATLFSSTIEVDGVASFDGAIDADSTSDFSGNMNLSGTATLTVAGLITASGGVNVTGNVAFTNGCVTGNGIDPDTTGGSLAESTSGKKVVSNAALTIPNTAIGDGFWQGLIEVGADTHDWTFNSLTIDISAEGFVAGEIYSVIVGSASTIDISGPAGTFTEANFA